MDQIIPVAPSSFSFLYDECPRCFRNEVLGLRRRPRAPFPTIFTSIDTSVKRHFAAGWHQLDPALPRFRIYDQGRRVVSRPVAIPGAEFAIAIRGNYDSRIVFETGQHGVIDWKTSDVRPQLVEKYARSLHAYAFALEQPMVGEAQPIARLGLGVFQPTTFDRNADATATLTGDLRWLDIPRDDARFEAFLQDVGRVLADPNPGASFDCPFCSYRESA